MKRTKFEREILDKALLTQYEIGYAVPGLEKNINVHIVSIVEYAVEKFRNLIEEMENVDWEKRGTEGIVREGYIQALKKIKEKLDE